MNTFGQSVAKGAGIGALGMAAVTADTGNYLVNAATGGVVGGVIGGVKHVKDALADKKVAKRRAEGYAAAKARHAALRAEQFDK